MSKLVLNKNMGYRVVGKVGKFDLPDVWKEILDIPLKHIYSVIGNDILRYETGFIEDGLLVLDSIIVSVLPSKSGTSIEFIYSSIYANDNDKYMSLINISKRKYAGLDCHCRREKESLVVSVYPLSPTCKYSIREVILKFLNELGGDKNPRVNKVEQLVVKDFDTSKREITNNPMKIVTI